ncbi:hypothetical protein Tco_0883720 [Tanacetum coccineum]
MDMVRVQVPRCMTWLDYDEHVDSLSTMGNEVGVTSPESTTKALPSFEEYTPPVTYPEEVEETLGTPITFEQNKNKGSRLELWKDCKVEVGLCGSEFRQALRSNGGDVLDFKPRNEIKELESCLGKVEGEGEDLPLSLCEGEDSPLSLHMGEVISLDFCLHYLTFHGGSGDEKNYQAKEETLADRPDNAYPKRSITKLILKGAVIFDVVSYQFRCALNYSKLLLKLLNQEYVARIRGKLIQKLLLNQKCMGYLVRAYYSISPTKYYKDDSCWSADLKSNTTEDVISI